MVVTAHPARHARPHRVTAVASYLPTLLLTAFVVVTLMRFGVDAADMARYALYWAGCVVLPGLVVSRLLLRVRPTIVEDLALGAVTGISLEVLAWVAGVTTGLGDVVRFWWVPVLAAGALVPALRRRVLVRVPARVPLPHSVGLAAISGYLVTSLSSDSYVYAARLPPHGGDTYFDTWWQLSLVQEMARYERPQIPQLSGEPFHYHYFANVQMASGVRLSGVSPEVVTLRLWFVPVILIGVGLAVALGHTLTRSLTGGVVTAGVAYVLAITDYLWPGQLGLLAASLRSFTSPSQLLANLGLTACAYGATILLRGGQPRAAVGWVALVVAGASADKSTIVPLLLAGTVVVMVRAAVTRSWVAVRWLAVAVVALLVLQAAVAQVAAGTEGGRLAVLAPIRFMPVFGAFVPDTGLIGTNRGLLLDTVDSPRAAGYALLALVVVLGYHLVQLVGVAGLLRRGVHSVREQYVYWWLAGGVLAGYAAMLSIDHIGSSEIFFGSAAGLLGSALTVAVLWDALSRLGRRGRVVVASGLATGCLVTLLVDTATALGLTSQNDAPLARILVPPVVVAAVAAVGWLGWRRVRTRWTRDTVWAHVLAAIIGVAVPGTVVAVVMPAIHWFEPARAPEPPTVTTAEQRAMLWLRAHSATDDVVATNAHCVDVITTVNCSARGFWVSGLSGRRVVLEGWAYTPEGQSRQGVDGRTYDRQPSPDVERARLTREVFDDSDPAALAELRADYGVRWLVSVHRAGPTPTFPDAVARVRFDNGAVTVLRVSADR